MSSTSKIIIREGNDKYKWSQTDESISIHLPIKNVLLKQIDILYTDYLLKVNATSIKYFAAIDFAHEIDFMNAKNRVQLTDGRLEVFLTKKVANNSWTSLEIKGLTKQELMTRRSESVGRYYEAQEKRKKEAQETIYKMEKRSVDQQMKVEGHERKFIKNTKKEELAKAQEELFSDLNDVNELDQKLTQTAKEIDRTPKDYSEVTKSAV